MGGVALPNSGSTILAGYGLCLALFVVGITVDNWATAGTQAGYSKNS
jgi:hypothetical protein